MPSKRLPGHCVHNPSAKSSCLKQTRKRKDDILRNCLNLNGIPLLFDLRRTMIKLDIWKLYLSALVLFRTGSFPFKDSFLQRKRPQDCALPCIEIPDHGACQFRELFDPAPSKIILSQFPTPHHLLAIEMLSHPRQRISSVFCGRDMVFPVYSLRILGI